MNILQYFHKKETLPPIEAGDIVRLKYGDAFEKVRKIYNKYYPNCYVSKKEWHGKVRDKLVKLLGCDSTFIVTRVEEGTPAAGGWFVYIGKQGYHGNIFELIK